MQPTQKAARLISNEHGKGEMKDLYTEKAEVNSGDTLLISGIQYQNTASEYFKPQRNVSILNLVILGTQYLNNDAEYFSQQGNTDI